MSSTRVTIGPQQEKKVPSVNFLDNDSGGTINFEMNQTATMHLSTKAYAGEIHAGLTKGEISLLNLGDSPLTVLVGER